ncbi:MAG: hypothetical protein ACM3PX_05960 [Omnitrophica WOR_2 bacterium]|jgi:hypothetical protein
MNTLLLKIGVTNGLLMITLLAFVISMLVAVIIWLLASVSSGHPVQGRGEKAGLPETIKAEIKHFLSFQRVYRTYWYSGNAPSNELITFYHEQ